MKQTLLFIVLCIVHQSMVAQESRLSSKKVSEGVKQYLNNFYPGLTKVKYYKSIEHDTLFIEVDFKWSIDNYSLLFFPEGGIYEVEREVIPSEFPNDIKALIYNEINQQVKKFKVLKCYEVNECKGICTPTDLLYEINIKTNEGYYELFFDYRGRFIKKVEIIIQPISTIN